MTDAGADDDDPTLWIIAEVKKPIKARYNHIPIEKRSVDLASHEESLRQLIRKAEWSFQLAKDELEPRLAGYKRKLSDNTTAQPDELVDPEYDYSALGSDGVPTQQEWEAHYDLFHKKGRGKPSTNQARAGGPPPIFLHGVLTLVEGWWNEHFGAQSFDPKFGGVQPPYFFENFNAEARLLHLIVQHCDPRYVPANTVSLLRTQRDDPKRPTKKTAKKTSKKNRP